MRDPLWKFDSGLLGEFPVLCGVDEVGRGPLAGNVVAACVVLDFRAKPIRGLDDSKKLSPAVRGALSAEIRERAVAYGVGECSPDEIDRHNILRASLLAMRRALEAMGVPPGLLLVDGNQRIPDVRWPQRTLVKGDGRSASIAAASILAKVVRDRQMLDMHALYPDYGFDRHKGYATLVHRRAIEKHGLTPIHRKSFCIDPREPEDLFDQDVFDPDQADPAVPGVGKP
ncbi:MAG TPA: ribonuclease HII [Fibrobacteria bacterium]|nr:ribonuclease HII [Fibrobacteria bacterium]